MAPGLSDEIVVSHASVPLSDIASALTKMARNPTAAQRTALRPLFGQLELLFGETVQDDLLSSVLKSKLQSHAESELNLYKLLHSVAQTCEYMSEVAEDVKASVRWARMGLEIEALANEASTRGI